MDTWPFAVASQEKFPRLRVRRILAAVDLPRAARGSRADAEARAPAGGAVGGSTNWTLSASLFAHAPLAAPLATGCHDADAAALADEAFSLDDFLELAAFSPSVQQHTADLLVGNAGCAPRAADLACLHLRRAASRPHLTRAARMCDRCSFVDTFALGVDPDHRMLQLECQLLQARKEVRRAACSSAGRALGSVLPC